MLRCWNILCKRMKIVLQNVFSYDRPDNNWNYDTKSFYKWMCLIM